MISQGLKIHIDNEFRLFSYLGQNLPGALVATPMEPQEVPDALLATHGKAKAIKFEVNYQESKFSLAGVQMKFSMKEKDGRYNLTKNTEPGDWIVETPSTRHKNVPLNEYTSMSLAALGGVDIPKIKLVELNKLTKLDNLPQINLANSDAHLKNWSLLYQDQITPRLSPAYDIVTTSVYIDEEKEYALNLGKTKKWFSVTLENFQYWANKSGIPWRAIKPHIADTMEKARELWPEALKDLPMDEAHKDKLKTYWQKLQADFRIETAR